MEIRIFEWAQRIYGAFYKDNIIILDVDNNKYLAIDPDTSKYLSFILTRTADKELQYKRK